METGDSGPATQSEHGRPLFAAWLVIKVVIDRRVSNFDPTLPVSFYCPQCKQKQRLRGEEVQSPKHLSLLSFACPGCQAKLKANVDQSHWVNDATGRKSVFVLDRIELA